MKFRNFIEKHWLITFVFCILFAVAGLEIYDVFDMIFGKVISNERIAGTLGRMIASLAVGLFSLYYFKKDRKCLGIQRSGFWKGLFIGGFMIVATISNLYSAFDEASAYSPVKVQASEVVIIAVEALFIGMLEEFLFRGLIFNIFMAKVQTYTYKEVMKAVVGSAVIFGGVHLLNLITYPNLIKVTLIQVEYAMFIGMIFAIVYFRSRNIWVVVFLHFIYDFASDVPYAFYDIPQRGEIADCDMATAIAGAIVNVTFLAVALILSRKIIEKPSEKNVD